MADRDAAGMLCTAIADPPSMVARGSAEPARVKHRELKVAQRAWLAQRATL